ncbi:hypothetical protein H5410_045243 [Solanum commersonii]|uniref:Uncharacterized protein n=1 Tax=Solanum commersonii TaxID=4109 RepID=A0A9J5X8Z9_SOLCO|nr:hypothetical protein H5410_045243 [Solanum commersonii]
MSIESEILFKIGSVLMTYHPNNDSVRFLKVPNRDHLGEAKNYIDILVGPLSQKISVIYVVRGLQKCCCIHVGSSKIHYFWRIQYTSVDIFK